MIQTRPQTTTQPTTRPVRFNEDTQRMQVAHCGHWWHGTQCLYCGSELTLAEQREKKG